MNYLWLAIVAEQKSIAEVLSIWNMSFDFLEQGISSSQTIASDLLTLPCRYTVFHFVGWLLRIGWKACGLRQSCWRYANYIRKKPARKVVWTLPSHVTRPEIVVICWLFHKLKLKVLVEPEAHPCEQTESCFTLCKNHCSGFSLWQELSTQTFAIFCAWNVGQIVIHVCYW